MTTSGRFATAVSCIDGRFQTRVIDQVMLRFGVRHVDNVTAPGAVRHLAGTVTDTGEFLLDHVRVSIDAHDSTEIAVVAHAGCAGNPVPDAKQKEELRAAKGVLEERYPGTTVVALFLDPKIGFEMVR
ncbi:MAG: carbonic anhydrase [Acidimicrobiia bacterium]